MSKVWSRLLASLRPAHDDNPLVDQAPGMSLRDVVRRFWPFLRPMRGWLLLGLAILLAAPAIEVVEILLYQRLVDDVLVPADIKPLVTLGLFYIGLNLLSAVVSGADDYLSTWISQRFLVKLRTDVFKHVLSLPLHVQERRRLGDVMSRLTSDVAAVESFMVRQLTEGLASVIRLVFFVSAMFWLQWQLTLASLVVVPLFWWVATRFARFVKDVSRERRRRAGSMSAVTEENIANVPLVQAYNREHDAIDKFHTQNTAIASAELSASRIRSIFLPMTDLAELAGILLVVALGTWTLATDRLTLGGLLAFLTLMAQSFRPVRDLSDLLPSLYSATAGVERIVELLDEKAPVEKEGAVDLDVTHGQIHFDDVSVRYPTATKDALSEVDLSVAPGEVLGIVGDSGAGKSTLVRLLTRHVDASEGSVRIDGQDLRDVTVASLRDSVTVVLQETLLLDATVRENIAFARPDASAEEVEQAARAADAHDFISALPAGYDTRIGQRGRSLSGGQRQRIAFARALLRDSPILVLDEPTTGLDPASARRALQPLVEARQGRTTLVITHDPVALEITDRVVALDNGRLRSSTAEAMASGMSV